jgi:hypothetical protein
LIGSMRLFGIIAEAQHNLAIIKHPAKDMSIADIKT